MQFVIHMLGVNELDFWNAQYNMQISKYWDSPPN